MTKCAFLGLGVMGYPMAGHLTKAGYDVTVWNRTEAKAEAWGQAYRGGRRAEDPAAAIEGADFVFMCLGDDPDVLAVYDAMEPGIRNGMIIVDHTTASADLARDLYKRTRAKRADFIDAPISGGEAGAVNGALTVMCGGNLSAFEKAEPVMQAYSKSSTLIGDSGSGQLAKAVNQICIAGVVQGLAEGMHFAGKAGLDVAKVIEAISGGAAQSWQMENRWQTMLEGKYEHGFAVDWMRKDLRIALEAASANGADLALTKLVDGFYEEVQKMDGARWDTSSLLARLEKG